jgi:hypothetical protein
MTRPAQASLGSFRTQTTSFKKKQEKQDSIQGTRDKVQYAFHLSAKV